MKQFLPGNIPLRHLLIKETLFMSWWRSAMKEVNDWAMYSFLSLKIINNFFGWLISSYPPIQQLMNILMFHRSFEMYFPNNLLHGKPFIISQEQRDVIQMVSTQFWKKDVIIFGKIDSKFWPCVTFIFNVMF